MPNEPIEGAPRFARTLPPHWRAVPIDAAPSGTGDGAPLRICAILVPVESSGPSLCAVDASFGTTAWLGCVTDRGGRVQEWLQLWTQTPEQLRHGASDALGLIHNETIDRAWAKWLDALLDADDWGRIETGWERTPMPPLILDVGKATASVVRHPSLGKTLTLCRDEERLASMGAPPYCGSLERTFATDDRSASLVSIASSVVREIGANSTSGAESRITESSVLFNIAGGPIVVRRLESMSLDQYLAILSGQGWDAGGTPHWNLPLQHALRAESVGGFQTGFLYGDAAGECGHLAEVFARKIAALRGCVAATAVATRRSARPHLRLDPQAFRVCLADETGSLPRVWTASISLPRPSGATRVELQPGGPEVFVASEPLGATLYSPVADRSYVRGLGAVVVRTIEAATSGQRSSSGVAIFTLRTEAKLGWTEGDFVRLELPLGAHGAIIVTTVRFDDGAYRLFADLESLDDQTRGLLVGRQWPQLPRVPFEWLRASGAGADLHALGVLGLNALFSTEPGELAEVYDDVVGLARECRDGKAVGADLAQQLRERLSVPAGLKRFGPHRCVRSGLRMAPEDALGAVPLPLWSDALAAVMRLFPDLLPDAYGAELRGFSPAAAEPVYRSIIADLDEIERQARSLLIVDWTSNRELHAIVRRVATGFSAE